MKRIIYSLMAMLLVFTGSLQAQTTKAIPEDPTVPHFIRLELSGKGTFTATANNGLEDITFSADNGNVDLPHGTMVTLTAEPAEGWKLDNIMDVATNESVSNPYKLEENVTLRAVFVEEDAYSVILNTPHITLVGAPISVKEGEPLDVTVKADENWLLPEKDAVRLLEGVTGVEVENFGYELSEDKTEARITMEAVKGSITIVMEAIDNNWYDIMIKDMNVTYENAVKKVQAGKPLNTITFKAKEGFKLPATVTVTMGGRELVNGVDYAYALNEDGTAALEIVPVTGDVVIFITGISLTEIYTVTYSEAVNFRYDNELGDGQIPETVPAGDPLKVLVIPDAGYIIPYDLVKVTMGGTELDVEDVYLFSEEMGIIGTITIEEVTGDVEISVEAFKVTLDNVLDDSGLDGIIIEEVPMIVLYDPLPLNLLVAEEGYHLPETIRVEKNEVLQTEGVDYTYDAETGKLVINRLDGYIKIYAEAVADEPKPDPDPEDPDDPTPTPDPDPEDPDDPEPTPTPDPDPDEPDVPTATADISGDVVKVWAANGVLHIHTPQPATVRVVSFSGALFRLMDVPGGDVQFTLPDNLYIVTVGDEVKKIKVR